MAQGCSMSAAPRSSAYLRAAWRESPPGAVSARGQGGARPPLQRPDVRGQRCRIAQGGKPAALRGRGFLLPDFVLFFWLGNRGGKGAWSVFLNTFSPCLFLQCFFWTRNGIGCCGSKKGLWL